jgi:hypothetical protein
MSNIKKISALLFLLAQMSVAFAGNPTDPSDRTYVGFWLVRQANDEIKQVKFVEMPASVLFEGTEDVNEPMVKELLGYKAIETFEGASVEESLFMVVSVDAGEDVEAQLFLTFADWCYNTYYILKHCKKGAGQCLKPGATICKGMPGNICFPPSMQMFCSGSGE